MNIERIMVLARFGLRDCADLVRDVFRGREQKMPEIFLEVGPGVTMKLVRIPAGEFTMGSDKGGKDEKPAHRVLITKAFYLGAYQVMQAEYKKVIEKMRATLRKEATLHGVKIKLPGTG